MNQSKILLCLMFGIFYISGSNITLQELHRVISKAYPEIIFNNKSNRSNPDVALATWKLDSMELPLNRFILGTLYNIILDKDPNKTKRAKVRFFGEDRSISSEEKEFWNKRDLFACDALTKILGKPITPNLTPRIALISSGGGCRATISLAGFANKLNQLGLLDAVHVLGGVSGASWLVFSWLASKKPYAEFYPEFVERVLHGILGGSPENMLTNITSFSGTMAECFLRRLAFHEIPTTIDLYGLLLGLHFFDQKTKKNYAFSTLSSHRPFVAKGTVPLPIGTAIVQHDGKPSDEVEFNPFETINYGLKAGCPSFGFGRDFYNGKSMSKHPAQTLGFTMGICGSAFSQKVKNYIPSIKTFLKSPFLNPILDVLAKTPIGESRLFPAYIRNYTRGMNDSPDKNTLFHAYIDAGLHYDAPMLPVLNPDRNIDIIILIESGSNVNWSGSLKVLHDIAQVKGYPFPKIDLEIAQKNTYSVFSDGPGSNAPIVIYVPLIKNPRYSESFDPWSLIYPYQNNFMNMLNFSYTRDQYNLLAGLFETAAEELYSELKELIEAAITKKAQGIRPQNT